MRKLVHPVYDDNLFTFHLHLRKTRLKINKSHLFCEVVSGKSPSILRMNENFKNVLVLEENRRIFS